MKEFIICSAIHVEDGKVHEDEYQGISTGFIVTGRRHHDCYRTLSIISGYNKLAEWQDIIQKPETMDEYRSRQGFITSTNRYVNRFEAFGIAWKANQLINPAAHTGSDIPMLTSEDLW